MNQGWVLNKTLSQGVRGKGRGPNVTVSIKVSKHSLEGFPEYKLVHTPLTPSTQSLRTTDNYRNITC